MKNGVDNLKRQKLDEDSGLIITLDEVGTFIWENMNGRNTVHDIIVVLRQEYAIEEEKLKEDIVNFIENLRELDVVFIDWRSM